MGYYLNDKEVGIHVILHANGQVTQKYYEDKWFDITKFIKINILNNVINWDILKNNLIKINENSVGIAI